MKRQHGMSMLGLLIVALVVVFFAIMGMKVVPSVLEFWSITKSIKGMVSSGEARSGNPAAVRQAFDRFAEINAVTAIRGADLLITKSGSRMEIGVSYSDKIPLVGPASLVMDYDWSTSANTGD